MLHRGYTFLCLCIMFVQLVQEIKCGPPANPEVRARLEALEAKVESSMSLKDLEAMVETDESVRNAPNHRIVILPKNKDPEAAAYIIQRKPSKSLKKESFKSEYKYDDIKYDDDTRRSSFEPNYPFESSFRQNDDFPNFFGISDLDHAGSSPVNHFYESLVESVLESQKFGMSKDPMALLEFAASEDVPSYQPRFDYDSYSKDSTETKLKGKTYWKDMPERREEKVDENGCRTVVKKIVDPEDEKKSSSAKAKSVVITKECEYPTIDGPDAKIPELQSKFRSRASHLDADSSTDIRSYDEGPSNYENTRPSELEFGKPSGRDSLAPDYIDKMLETHFRSFPGFKNPITSFRGYQERFNLRAPEAFKDIKPKVGVHTYEYSHPQSGFSEDSRAPISAPSEANDESPRVHEHHYHYDYPPKSTKEAEYRDYDDEKQPKSESKSGKDPKMVKKSFAYYRKDNPKTDPNDQQYAEEYAQGNFRSFSSSYDSEKDGPRKA